MAIVKYCVNWQIPGEDKVYQGSPTDYQTAKSWADKMNKDYPQFKYWVTDAAYDPEMAKHYDR